MTKIWLSKLLMPLIEQLKNAELPALEVVIFSKPPNEMDYVAFELSDEFPDAINDK